ncbi:hypothetical protein E2C01_098754 [Portunus trituberculatus]|uniref:Uncharacterized protein n=1 Tax=Portunus trituberculatus TaxID=210409 RepID=A0A5B7K211_PORTR|nr:hypothetical protein [Portunus trituberculatus]
MELSSLPHIRTATSRSDSFMQFSSSLMFLKAFLKPTKATAREIIRLSRWL